MIRIKCQGCGARTIVCVTPGTCQAVACSGCGMELVEFEALRGSIYVLSHPQMPKLLKIGFTTRQVEERVAELNAATAVPGPFIIEGVFPSSDPEQHESVVHGMLAECRVENKEFFRVDLIEALRTVLAACGPASYLRTPDLLNKVQLPGSAKAEPPDPKARRWGEPYVEYLERMRKIAH